jgi:dTMP kinase
MDRLIVIEGLDGAGKSTQMKQLVAYLEKSGVICKQQHFPRTEGIYGQLIARFLRGELGAINQVDPYLTALIYACDRLEFKADINKWLSEENVVLLDRYVYSNVAYQCAKITDEKERKKLRDWILNLEFEHNKLPKPCVNIFLDVPLTFARENLKNRKTDYRQYLQGKDDIHEADNNFQENVRQMYLSLAVDGHIFTIDCSDGQNILPANDIYTKILDLLNYNKILMI